MSAGPWIKPHFVSLDFESQFWKYGADTILFSSLSEILLLPVFM